MKVLIVTFRRLDLLRRCVSELGSYFAMSDVLVVDNHSEESESIADYCRAGGIELMRNSTNEGFAKAVNIGMRRLVTEGGDPWVLLLNTDAELLVDPRDLTAVATANTACITTFDAAATSPWDSEKPIPNPWRAAWEDSGFGRIRIPQPFGSRYRTYSENHRGYLVGCFLVVSTAAWKQIGPFDERFWLYSEEADWCVRAYGAGMDCTVIPILGYRHEARRAAEGHPTAGQSAMSAYWNSRTVFIEKHWGSPGRRAYTLSRSALTGLRKFAGAIRTLRA